MNTLQEFEVRDFDANDDAVQVDVKRILEWSAQESMVSITEVSILGHRFAVAAYDGEDIVGYGAITQVYSPSIIEVGGLLTSPDHRRCGVATAVLRKVVSDAKRVIKPERIIAFSNNLSGSLFIKLGGNIIVHPAAELPKEVWKLCENCRFYDEQVLQLGKLCCGRVFDVTAIEAST